LAAVARGVADRAARLLGLVDRMPLGGGLLAPRGSGQRDEERRESETERHQTFGHAVSPRTQAYATANLLAPDGPWRLLRGARLLFFSPQPTPSPPRPLGPPRGGGGGRRRGPARARRSAPRRLLPGRRRRGGCGRARRDRRAVRPAQRRGSRARSGRVGLG